MYGGQPAGEYGLTMAQPAAQQPAPDPYGGASPAAVTRALLSGPSGVHTVNAGVDFAVGSDSARCQIMLNEPRISGVHATLRVDAGQLYVRDEQSNNGTFVDGHRLAPNVWTAAPAGSTLRFGPVEFNIRLE
jgi:pSer/pThr/pTyr-binding forkhead associated (FHA) protein